MNPSSKLKTLKYFFIVLFCFVFSTVLGKDTIDLDSLRKSVEVAEDDTSKILNLLNLAEASYYRMPQVAVSSVDEALLLSRKLNFKKGEARALAFQSIILAEEGLFYVALNTAKKAEKIALEINDGKGLLQARYSKGSVFADLSKYEEAFEEFQLVIDYAAEHDNFNTLFDATGKMADLYQTQGDYERALKYLEEFSFKYKDQLTRDQAIMMRTKVARLNFLMKNYEMAKNNVDSVLDISKKHDFRRGLAAGYEIKGNIYLEEKDFYQALKYFLLSLKNYEHLKDQALITESYINIGTAYYELDQMVKAQYYAERAREKSNYLNLIYLEAEAYGLLSKIYKKNNNLPMAYERLLHYTVLKDSINKLEQKEKLSELQLKNEFELKERDYREQQQIAQNEAKEAKLRERNTLIIGISLFVIFIGATIFYYQRKKYKNREIEKAKEAESLKKLDKLKDDFLANTSHELRTPLNGIIGIAESLMGLDVKSNPQEIQKNISLIISSGRRLAGLVDSILDFSKLKSHSMNLNKKPIDLYSLVDVVLRISLHAMAGKDIKLINDIDKEFPSVYADEDRLQQILHNLIGNAIKFTEAGSITIYAKKDSDSMAEICVKDTGIGIPEDKKEKIFESFEQLDPSIERKYGGTGLGLAITKQLVELHEGKIHVESTFGEGAIFCFSLPLSKEKGEIIQSDQLNTLYKTKELKESSIAKITAKRKHIHGGANIALVDDEQINQQVVANFLADENVNLDIFSNGADGLKAIMEKDYELILLDIMMPGMSGYEVCKNVRKKYLASDLPIIMLTAKNQVSDLVEALSYGANDYLAKPFSKDEFLARIHTHLSLKNINNAYTKFIPREFLNSLGHENILQVKLGDSKHQEMTVLFSDIRGYTTMSENMSPPDNFKFLNAYLRRIGPGIKANHGFINQYYGDGIMALFENNPQYAVEAAIDMQLRVTLYNKERKKKKRTLIEIGVGLHKGPLMIGVLGDEKRMNAGVVSDSVNTAARIEGLTKFFGCKVIASETVLADIMYPGNFHYRLLGIIKMIGKHETIKVYDFYDADDKKEFNLKKKLAKDFDKALNAYLNESFDEAIALFEKICKENPYDKAACIYLEKASNFKKSKPEGWSGVFEMDGK